MPDNQDNNSMDNMSINDVNELFEDVIEIPDEYKFISALASRIEKSVDVRYNRMPC